MAVYKGLDKIEISGFNVVAIDYEKLEKHKNIILKTEGETVFKSNKRIAELKITNDELFTSLFWKVSKKKNSYIECCFLNLNITEEQKNLIPYNVKKYRDKLNRALVKLKDVYGVVLMGKAEAKSVEYNKTIILDKSIKEYEKSLLILEKVVPNRLKSIVYRGKNRDVEIVYIKNKSRGYKFYNKAKQLEEIHNIKINKEVLRIEYSMFTKEKIKDELGSADINDWTDEQLEEMFKKNFKKDFIIPYEKAYENNIKTMIKMAKEYRSKQSKNWIDKTIIQSQKEGILFAKEQINEVAKKMDKKHIGRLNKRIDNQFGDCKQKERIEEIFKYIMEC